MNSAPTLYGRTLTVTVEVDGAEISRTWSEEIYDEETDAARASIQALIWQIGLGPEASR